MAKLGKPPTIKSPEELEKKVNAYFISDDCKKEVIIGKGDNKQVVKLPFPTIAGLALYCGFISRQSMYDYELKPDYAYIIKKARMKIESHYEYLLQNGLGVGAIFALKQFGWVDKSEIDHTVKEYLYDTFKDKDKTELARRARELAERIVANRAGTCIPSEN